MPIPKLTPGPGETYDASQKPPPFGHPLKAYFALDEDYVNLNHGMPHVTRSLVELPEQAPMTHGPIPLCRIVWLPTAPAYIQD